MMFLSLSKKKGVTLLEVLLVLVIASSILVMIISYSTQKMNQLRMDKTVMQMQQILNAGLAYYVNTGDWPATLDAMKPAYLPSALNNPWGGKYTVNNDRSTGVFKVTLTLSSLPASATTTALLNTLAGQLPVGALPVDIANKAITAQVNIPGQNLNNARSINFASIYPSGACVPAPICPGQMVPQIMVVPVAARGINDTPTPVGSTPVVYPLTSFTAFARGEGDDNVPTDNSLGPKDCAVLPGTVSHASYPCQGLSDEPTGTKYWRVCLSVVTERGIAYPDRAGSGGTDAEKGEHILALGSVLALTRCAPPSEKPSGTPFTVFTPNQMWEQ